MASILPFKTENDYNNYLKRLEQIQTRLAEQTDLFRRAIALNRTLNRVSVSRVPGQIEKFLTDDVIQFSLFGPFNETLDNLTLSEEKKNELRGRAVVVLINNVMNPYREFKTFLENEYIPATRAGWGVSSWHRGQEYYKACLKWHLSEDKTAEEIHELGLQEVSRISGQMLKIIRGKDFNGTIREYFQLLKADPQFKLSSGEAILEEYKSIVYNRVNKKLKDYFENIPNLPLEIKPMPYDGPGGAYSPGSADGSRPGIFWVNVLRPNATNTFDMMALTLHEANPGHHMQISAASLLPLPDFRKFTAYSMYNVPLAFPAYTAYIEGWGLYSEYLGEEMELYKDEYELLGRYAGEIYRACRLVVDTGLHSLGWEREEAIQYMLNYTSSDRPDIEVEIDRYITWPGQACAYKYGEIKILELRRKAQLELGDKFNLKQFHDVILGLAAVPLQVMEDAVDEMIQHVKDAQKQPSSVSRTQAEWIALSFALIIALAIGA
ncbi:uncharacterized protein LOC135479048 isoform X2 [Liolophura sinensis]|uniref:uncharacterized protein LOC135479048 isoform X2 n=1 Tax=Liolophura sinensis TaxID=3198878 RepID=UPI0031589D2B